MAIDIRLLFRVTRIRITAYLGAHRRPRRAAHNAHDMTYYFHRICADFDGFIYGQRKKAPLPRLYFRHDEKHVPMPKSAFTGFASGRRRVLRSAKDEKERHMIGQNAF